LTSARRIVLAPFLIAGVLLSLAVAPGCCKRGSGPREKAAGTGRVGVEVTTEVPHSKETIGDIEKRERTNPLPVREDTAIPSHKVHRAAGDNAVPVRPNDDNTMK
jgi:hypothetical protein